MALGDTAGGQFASEPTLQPYGGRLLDRPRLGKSDGAHFSRGNKHHCIISFRILLVRVEGDAVPINMRARFLMQAHWPLVDTYVMLFVSWSASMLDTNDVFQVITSS